MSYNFIVQYGVNCSHMTEIKVFDLYRDAKSFYKAIDGSTFKAKVIYRQIYTFDGFQSVASGRALKDKSFEPGVCYKGALKEIMGW